MLDLTSFRTSFFFRDPRVVAFGTVDACLFSLPSGETFGFEGQEAHLARAVFGQLADPTSGEALLTANELSSDRDVLDVVWELIENRIIRGGTEEDLAIARAELDQTPPASKPCRHLVVGVSGSVQAVDVSAYLEPLRDLFCQELEVILTEGALHFTDPRALQYVLGKEPWTDLFEPRDEINVPHIHLARWADLMVIVPASAHTIQRLATGACSDMLSLVAMATRAPLVVVPAMNAAMWEQPAIQRNLFQLRADGAYVVEPGFGHEMEDRDRGAQLGPPGATPHQLLSVLHLVMNRSSSR